MRRIIIALIFGSLFLFTTKDNTLEISEEATPIWKDNLIESLDYRLTINDNKEKRIVYNTKIIESINHYLDISKRDSFTVNLKLINNSHDKYYLKKIVIANNTGVIKSYNYHKLLDYTEIELLLGKEIIEKITNHSKNNITVKIIIEK